MICLINELRYRFIIRLDGIDSQNHYSLVHFLYKQMSKYSTMVLRHIFRPALTQNMSKMTNIFKHHFKTCYGIIFKQFGHDAYRCMTKCVIQFRNCPLATGRYGVTMETGHLRHL